MGGRCIERARCDRISTLFSSWNQIAQKVFRGHSNTTLDLARRPSFYYFQNTGNVAFLFSLHKNFGHRSRAWTSHLLAAVIAFLCRCQYLVLYSFPFRFVNVMHCLIPLLMPSLSLFHTQIDTSAFLSYAVSIISDSLIRLSPSNTIRLPSSTIEYDRPAS